MASVKISPDFMANASILNMERDKGIGYVRAMLALLAIIDEGRELKNVININGRESRQAKVFLDELKYRTKMLHQNKLEEFLEYCNDRFFIFAVKNEGEGSYTIGVDKTHSMFFSME